MSSLEKAGKNLKRKAGEEKAGATCNINTNDPLEGGVVDLHLKYLYINVLRLCRLIELHLMWHNIQPKVINHTFFGAYQVGFTGLLNY